MRACSATLLIAAWLVLCAFQPEGIIVHHTATPNGREYSYAQCREYHVGERGWDDCGYNFLIQPNGSIDVARGWDRVGAHTKGKNRTHLGVAFVGKFDSGKDALEGTSAQVEGFREWYKETVQKRFGHLPISMHSEHGKTLCPGDIGPIIKEAGHV